MQSAAEKAAAASAETDRASVRGASSARSE